MPGQEVNVPLSSEAPDLPVIPSQPLPRQPVPQTNSLNPADSARLRQDRQSLVEQTVQALDNSWHKKAQYSADRTWCKPVSREIQLRTVQAFHNAMHDESTLEVGHCVVCYQQQAPKQLIDYAWAEFETLYSDVRERIPPQDREHFLCHQCFPRETSARFPVCTDCDSSLKQARLPRACQVNNLSLGCVHRYPEELKTLSPLEERLIGIYTPCGWITKLNIDIEKVTTGRYRKHKRGHITVFPNDVQGLANALPHPLVEELERLHVCFVAPRKPVPQDLAFMLSANPQKIKRALVWLKRHNHLYRDIQISEDALRSWGQWCPGTEVPRAVFDEMVPYELNAEDQIRTGHYVPAAERGREEQPVRSAEEVLASLEDRETDTARLEADSNGRLGAIHSRYLDTDELYPRQIEQELSELTSTGLMSTEMEGEHSPLERLRMLQRATMEPGRRYRGRKPGHNSEGISIAYDSTEPLLVSRRGEEYADTNDPDFFPKAFPCLFPWGRGGPKVLADNDDGEEEANLQDGYQERDFRLRAWAQLLLQRHGQ
jgi:hypothetical protein